MIESEDTDSHGYPVAHLGWGRFAEELFDRTSRHVYAVEAFLSSLGEADDFRMRGYEAANLTAAQRELMAEALSHRPDQQSASAIIHIVGSVSQSQAGVVPAIEAHQAPKPKCLPKHHVTEHHHPYPRHLADIDPLDPFMILADRLLLPVAARDRHVDVSLRELAHHLRSSNRTLRTNLHNAIILMHDNGYALRNCPRLTHCRARTISENGR